MSLDYSDGDLRAPNTELMSKSLKQKKSQLETKPIFLYKNVFQKGMFLIQDILQENTFLAFPKVRG